MEEVRRWEEMSTDCMVNIFERLHLADLTVGAPFACKSWLAASLSPTCWKVLDLRGLDFKPDGGFARRFAALYSPPRFSFSGFMRFVIRRSRGSVVELTFPTPLPPASVEDLVYVANECPRMKALVLPQLTSEGEACLPGLVGRWRDLERLELESKPACFPEIARWIGVGCRRFRGLRMTGAIMKTDALAIAGFLPGLRHLDLSRSYLCREVLLAIVGGCKELESLRVSSCVGFNEGDEVLSRACGGIKNFEHEGSKLIDEYEREYIREILSWIM